MALKSSLWAQSVRLYVKMAQSHTGLEDMNFFKVGSSMTGATTAHREKHASDLTGHVEIYKQPSSNS